MTKRPRNCIVDEFQHVKKPEEIEGFNNLPAEVKLKVREKFTADNLPPALSIKLRKRDAELHCSLIGMLLLATEAVVSQAKTKGYINENGLL
jgi:hypothetical protein